jgi:toxin YhaV
MLTFNGWTVYFHPLFEDQLKRLIGVVAGKAAKDPGGYLSSGHAKLLATILKMCRQDIPNDPTSRAYLQGNTLGIPYRQWRRAKFGSGRFRLFFWYLTEGKSKFLIYVWFNDDDTLRAYGSKTDAYAVFRRMLQDGNPPNTWEELKASCSPKSNWIEELLDTARTLLKK